MIGFDELEGFLDKKREDLLEIVNGLQGKPHMKAGDWTVGDVVEHLVLTETFIVNEVKRLLNSNEPAPSEPLEEKAVDAFELFQAKGLLGVKRKAPKMVQPTGTLPLEEGLEKLHQIRKELKSFLPKLRERETNTLVSYLSPLGVNLNVCQWIHFASVHEWGHTNQLKAITQ